MNHLSLCILLILTVLAVQPVFTQEESTKIFEQSFSQIEELIAAGKFEESILKLKEVERHDREISPLDDVEKLNLAYLKALMSQRSGNAYSLSRQDSFLLYKPSRALQIPLLLKAKILNLQGIYFTSYPARNLDSSIYYFTAANEALKGNSDASSMKIKATLLENLGKSYYYKGEWIKAVPMIEESFEIKKTLFDSIDPAMAKSYTEYAMILSQMGNSRKSEELYEKALKIYEKNGLDESREVVSVYMNLARTYQRRGDYSRAKDFYERALNINMNYESSNSWLSTDIKSQIAQIFIQSGKVESGMKEMDKILASVKPGEDFELSDIAFLYVTFAKELYKIGKLSEAEKMLNQALEMFEKDEHANLTDYAVGLSYSVRLLIDKKNWLEAEKVNHFHREMLEQAYGTEHWTLCYFHHFQGEILMGRSKYEAARKKLRKCIDILEGDDLISVVQSNDAFTLADAYTLISKTFLKQYELIPNEEFLSSAKENILIANEIILKLQGSKLSLEDKIALRKYITKVSETLLQIEEASPKADLDFILRQLDQGKNQVLKESLSAVEDLNLADVPEEVIAVWSKLRDTVNFFESQWQADLTPEYSSSMKEKYLVAVKNLEEYNKLISKDYPQFEQLKQLKSGIQLSEVKENLRAKEGLVQYFWGTERIYIFYLDAERESFQSIVRDENLDTAIEDFRKTVSDPGSEMKVFLSSAYFLHEKLIQPIGDLPEKLIIIPDGILSYLPFEAFLIENVTASSDYRKLPYLIKECAISYNISLGLLRIMQNGQKRAGKLLAMAPDFQGQNYKIGDENIQFGKLINVETEVKAISKYFSGDYYVGAYATRANLIENIDEHTILHLATQGLIDENDEKGSFLAFSGAESGENKLLLEELYAMKWPLNLVVLSAFETIFGTKMEGKGIAVLSRALACAGVASLMTSLWLADNKASGQIMINFYENLSAGRQKDVALQQGKVKYLNEIIDIEKAHPYYWSNFVLYGDTAAIERSQTWTFIFMGLILAMLVAVVVALRRFK